MKVTVVSDSLQPHGLYSPWNSSDQNTGVGSLSLFRWIFPTQGSRPPALQEDSLPAEPQGKQLTLLVFFQGLTLGRTSLVAQMVKRLSTMQETQVGSHGQEDPLEKEMAAHSSTIAWKIPWTEEPGRLQSMGSQRVRHD